MTGPVHTVSYSYEPNRDVKTVVDNQVGADGNMLTTGDGWEYTWNGEDRLVEAKNVATDEKVTYAYDYQGRRSVKHIFGSYTGTVPVETTRYIYKGWNVVREVKETATGTTAKEHLWGLDLSLTRQGAGGVGGLLKSVSNADTSPESYYYTYDANGNVSEKLTSTGAVTTHYEYDAFGNIVNGATLSDGAYAFSTKPYDAVTGLYYYGYRYYDAGLGRWVNRDPIGEEGGINLTQFVGNAAVYLIDYLGHQRFHTLNFKGETKLPVTFMGKTAEIAVSYEWVYQVDCKAGNNNTPGYGGHFEQVHQTTRKISLPIDTWAGLLIGKALEKTGEKGKKLKKLKPKLGGTVSGSVTLRHQTIDFVRKEGCVWNANINFTWSTGVTIDASVKIAGLDIYEYKNVYSNGGQDKSVKVQFDCGG